MADKPTSIPVKSTAPAPAPRTAPLARGRDWPSFADLRREMDNLFEEFGRGIFSVPARWRDLEAFAPQLDLTPAVDIVESDGAFKVTTELPGMDLKDITVAIEGDMLAIRGEKAETRDADDKGRHVSERRYGSFERTFTVPPGIERDRVEASYANGVLTVTLPKSAEAKASTRKIDVRAA